MNGLKESFIIMKAITTRTTTLKMTILCHAVCMLGMLFKTSYNKPLINLDRLVIMGKYQTSVFMYGPRSDIFSYQVFFS